VASFALSSVSSDQLLVALIGALVAGVVAVGIAVWQFKAESRRSRAAAREQALLDSKSDLATRIWMMRTPGVLSAWIHRWVRA
jgi:hypothetical protein